MSTATTSPAYLVSLKSREEVAERTMARDRGMVHCSHRGYLVLNLKALQDYGD